MEIITRYFHTGYPNEIIREFLSEYHGITMSLRTLKRRLCDFGLQRNGNNKDIEERIRPIIVNEISNGSGASLGYRSMWHLLRLQYHIHVPRRVVAQVLREVDPEGVQLRQRRRLSRRRYVSYGPNFCCHVDGKCNDLNEDNIQSYITYYSYVPINCCCDHPLPLGFAYFLLLNYMSYTNKLDGFPSKYSINSDHIFSFGHQTPCVGIFPYLYFQPLSPGLL